MAKVNVLTPFKLNTESGIIEFAAGVQDVPEDVAGHWYAQEHLEPVGKSKAKAKGEDPAAEAAGDKPSE